MVCVSFRLLTKVRVAGSALDVAGEHEMRIEF
jgi:hypothetical protein